MRFPAFLRSRRFALYRRLALIVIIVVLAFRNYGARVAHWIEGFGGSDVILTHYEFRPELPEAKPAWIIGLKNESGEHTYEQVELEATYFDEGGKVLEVDRLVIRQKLAPGEEQMVASVDFKDRPGAQKGSLKVIDAERVP